MSEPDSVDAPVTQRENLDSAKAALLDAMVWLQSPPANVTEALGCVELALGRINDILWLADASAANTRPA